MYITAIILLLQIQYFIFVWEQLYVYFDSVGKTFLSIAVTYVYALKIVTVENYQRNLPEIINLFILILFII